MPVPLGSFISASVYQNQLTSVHSVTLPNCVLFVDVPSPHGAETKVDGLGFELIQPVSGPSIYQEFLDAHGEGVQHIACMKHSVDDSEALKKHWSERGAEILMGGRIGETIEFYYVDTGPLIKFVLESGSGHAIDLEPTYVYP